MKKGKIIYFSLLILTVLIVSISYFSYAFFTNKIEEHGKLNIIAGTLDYKLESSNLTDNKITLEANNSIQTNIKITSLNTILSKYELFYTLSNDKVSVEVGYYSDTLDEPKGIIASNETKEIKVIIKNNSSDKVTLTFGVHGGLPNIDYDDITEYGLALNEILAADIVIAWDYIGTNTKPTTFPSKNSGYYVDSVSCTNATGTWDNSSWRLVVDNVTGVDASCTVTFDDDIYTESILNGADPVLTSNLVPVIISDDGTVKKTNTKEKWYNYENKKWANAIVLKDTSISYNTGDTIPESNIESYFVWIPKYSYQIWDLGDYSSLTGAEAKEQVINIKFGLKNTSDGVSGECTTPMNEAKTQGLAGASGNCKVGDYMTNSAFISFNTNGFWVGKFETGYDGATTADSAKVNSSDSSKIIIKPNVYSWRYISVGNAFKASLEYLESDNSHMMKNTEWGAVAYLQHSQYGSATSVRINNNKSYITGYSSTEEPTTGYSSSSIDGNRYESTSLGADGTYTVNYFNSLSSVSSTTGNKSGIYDMAGGAYEYVMGYTTGATTVGGLSAITSLYSDFFDNSNYYKYYDKYSSTEHKQYNNRILGDATGEMGPFSSVKSSWYGDYADFVDFDIPWFVRGDYWSDGSYAGTFAFISSSGSTNGYISFRIVLAPTE